MTSRTVVLWALFTIQMLCCIYFVTDAVDDFIVPDTSDDATGVAGFIENDIVEVIVTLALFMGLAFSGSEILKLIRRQTQLDAQIQIASGAFSELLETRFGEWGLSQAERDIAVFSIKGLAISDMAQLRQTKPGTIKAQCASLYRKAGVSGRLELLSLFLDDLVADHLIPKPAVA